MDGCTEGRIDGQELGFFKGWLDGCPEGTSVGDADISPAVRMILSISIDTSLFDTSLFLVVVNCSNAEFPVAVIACV